jgi:DNA-binding transcriptional LysR family regulator
MIARHHTLSGAARALGVQQPTMGRRLEALESRAGARLLQKTPTGFVLTETGEAVLANAERIEAETLSVERLIAGHDVRLAGTIRLTTVETLAVSILVPILAAFGARHPAIEVEIAANTRALSLTKREADVALRIAPFQQADIVARKVGELGFGLYASADYLSRHGVPDWAQAGDGHRVVQTEPDLLETPEMQWLRGLAGTAGVALASNSRMVQRSAVEAGIGIGCLARYLGDPTPGLVRIPTPIAPPVRALWLGVHGDLRHMPRIRAFTTALQDGLKAASGQLNPGE